MLMSRKRTCLIHGPTVAGQLAQCSLHLQPSECWEIAPSGPGLWLWALPGKAALNVWWITCHSAIQQISTRIDQTLQPALGNEGVNATRPPLWGSQQLHCRVTRTTSWERLPSPDLRKSCPGEMISKLRPEGWMKVGPKGKKSVLCRTAVQRCGEKKWATYRSWEWMKCRIQRWGLERVGESGGRWDRSKPGPVPRAWELS